MIVPIYEFDAMWRTMFGFERPEGIVESALFDDDEDALISLRLSVNAGYQAWFAVVYEDAVLFHNRYGLLDGFGEWRDEVESRLKTGKHRSRIMYDPFRFDKALSLREAQRFIERRLRKRANWSTGVGSTYSITGL